MFLVLGITGKVSGATAKHLLAHGNETHWALTYPQAQDRGCFLFG